MAVTMQEQPTWSGDWKVMIVDTLSCWATMELTHWRNGVYQLNTRNSGYREWTLLLLSKLSELLTTFS